MTFLLGCKTEYRKTIETYYNGKTKIEYVYQDKADKSKYTIIAYYPNEQVSFKGTVDNNKFVGNGKLDETFENSNGVANGFVHIYKNDSSGKLGIIYTYRDNKKNGSYKKLYDTGELYSSGTYRNDTLVDHVYYF